MPTYIHRVGRTARYKANGKALLLLDPKEMKFLTRLKSKNIEISKLSANPNKQLSIQQSVQAFVAEEPDLKYLA